MGQACQRTRVVKKISGAQPGALKLARRYGDALVCVRYRHSLDGAVRYTTVELMVEQVRIVKRGPKDSEMVAVRLSAGEVKLRERIQASGGRWDGEARMWRLTRGEAKRLRLIRRVLESAQRPGL